MAITATSLTSGLGFAVNATSSDLSGCEELVAATAGKSIYLEQIYINSASAITVTIGAGETTGAVTAVILGPITFTTTGGQAIFQFTRPIILAAATALTVDASGAGAVQIFAQGQIK